MQDQQANPNSKEFLKWDRELEEKVTAFKEKWDNVLNGFRGKTFNTQGTTEMAMQMRWVMNQAAISGLVQSHPTGWRFKFYVKKGTRHVVFDPLDKKTHVALAHVLQLMKNMEDPDRFKQQ